MTIVILLVIFWSLSAVLAKKNILNYGAEAKINFANQLVYNPLNMESENYKWEKLTCFGTAAFLELQKNRKWAFIGKLGYNQKGFVQGKESAIRVENGSKVEAPYNTLAANKNCFHYATLDAVAKFNLGKKLLVPFLETGLSFNYLLAKKMRSAQLFEHSGNQLYDYKFYKKAALGLIAGVGATFDKKITLVLETNIDLTKSVNTANLVVQNWCYSITLGLNINNLLMLH